MIPPRLFSDQKRRGGAVEKGPGGTPGFPSGPLFDRLFPFATANRFSDLTETALSFPLSASEGLNNYL